MPNTPPPSIPPSSPSNPDPNPIPNPNPNPNPNQDQEDPQILSSDQEQEDPEPEMSGDPPSPPRSNPVTSSTLRRGKRKKASYKSQLALSKKLNTLAENLNLIPFNPAKVVDFTRFEAYLKRLDLWDFCQIEFDASLRSDLIAKLLASYNPKCRGSYVNEYKIHVSRAAVGKALRLPGKKGGDFEEYPDEFVSFLGEFVSSWMLLHGDEVWATPNEVVHWLGLIREKQLEKVDWAGLVWFMVEKEVSQGSGLRNCYYASHLQRLIKEQRAHLFVDELVGGDDGGEVKMVDVDDVGEVKMVDCEEVELVDGRKSEDRDGESKVVEGFGPVVGDDGEGDKVDKKVDDVDGEYEGGCVGPGVQNIESNESGKCVSNDVFVDGNVRTGDSVGERAENAGERAENAGDCAESAGERAENAVDCAESAGDRAENAGDCLENSGERIENDGECGEYAVENAENADLLSESTDTRAEKGDAHTENIDAHTEDVDEHTEDVDEHTEDVDEHTENVDEHAENADECGMNDDEYAENVDEHTENDDDNVKYSDEQVENDENAKEVSMDIDMMDLGYGKGDGQGHWLLSTKNDGGRFYLQRCSMDGMKPSFEDRRQDEADDDEDDDNDDGDDNGDDERVEGFKIMKKGPLEGMTSSNLVQDFETQQLQFAPQELGQSSRVDNNVIMGDPSMFNHFGKRPIGLEHDISHHGLNDNLKKPKFDSSVAVQKAADFSTCMDQMQIWFEKAKMSLEATRVEMCQHASVNEQILSHQIAEKDNEILQLRFKLDELHRRKQTDIHRRDRELYLMNSIIEGYRRALKQTQKQFTEFRKRHGISDEPVYKDAGEGGVVKSVMELEKERIKQEEEKKMMCQTIEVAYNMHLDDYMLQWEELDNKVLSLESKLNNASKELESLKNHLVKRKSSCVKLE